MNEKLNKIVNELKVSDGVKKWIKEDLDTFKHNYMITAKKSDKYSYDIFIQFAFDSHIFSMLLFNSKSAKDKNSFCWGKGVIRTILNAKKKAFGVKDEYIEKIIKDVAEMLDEYELANIIDNYDEGGE